MASPLSVLIIGGYGAFGGRLAHLLADESGLRLIIAGRSLAKATAFCRSVPFRAEAVPARFDRGYDPYGYRGVHKQSIEVVRALRCTRRDVAEIVCGIRRHLFFASPALPQTSSQKVGREITAV